MIYVFSKDLQSFNCWLSDHKITGNFVFVFDIDDIKGLRLFRGNAIFLDGWEENHHYHEPGFLQALCACCTGHESELLRLKDEIQWRRGEKEVKKPGDGVHITFGGVDNPPIGLPVIMYARRAKKGGIAKSSKHRWREGCYEHFNDCPSVYVDHKGRELSEVLAWMFMPPLPLSPNNGV